MTLDMDDKKPILCACGAPATVLNNLDLGVIAHCKDSTCMARGSAEIERSSRRHPARLKVYDAIRPVVMAHFGERAPTDRVLAIVHACLDMAGSMVGGIFKISKHPRWNEVLDEWKLDTINRLGIAMHKLASEEQPPQTSFPT